MGTEVTYEVNNNKGKNKSRQNKQAKCTIVRVEAFTGLAIHQ
jgi:hypothetical protein